MSDTNAKKNKFITFIDEIRYVDGEIKVNDSMLEEIRNSPVVIFRNVFTEDFLNNLRQSVVNFDFKYSDYIRSEDGLPYNYKRVDNLLSRERRARYNMGFHFYFWNNDTPSVVKDVYNAIICFGNKLSGRSPEDRLSLNSDKIGTVSFYYYPPGGCLDSHHFSDDIGGYDEIFDELVVFFGKYGRDHHQGGTYIAPRYKMSETYEPSNHGELIFIEPQLNPGDILAITIKDAYHKVTPIDPDMKSHLNPLNGRFLLVAYYVPQKDLVRISKIKGKEGN